LPAIALAMLSASGAFANAIGTVISVQTQAAVEQPGATNVLAVGAGVPQDATVLTNESGRAQLKFVDETMLTIGPSSSVKLDGILFTPERKAKTFVLKALTGAFVFATGKSSRGAYSIETPVSFPKIISGRIGDAARPRSE
jgi:hypothetical protein